MIIAYQYLFVCSANKDRSKTAEDFFSSQYPQMFFESAGTNDVTCQKLGTNHITIDMLEKAYRVYVMETKHQTAIQKKFGNQFFNKIIVLQIPDLYKYGSIELINILKKRVCFDS
ncbi:cellular communication/signal transduction [Nonlabens ulvanivorans]|nr:phosphotyrosine protein phosphatase [Nonlabens ulvanivorans]GAK90607.1 cellular communication/signal transduction [Nonlabens ulvanivorans]GAK94048.1 cellular communication/signal transduction [Nonlabens ulvanivorans]